MFSKANNQRGLLSYSGNAAFKKHIAPKIAEHIQRPIDVQLMGEDTCLNAWLIENLSTILPIHVTLEKSTRRLAKSYFKRS